MTLEFFLFFLLTSPRFFFTPGVLTTFDDVNDKRLFSMDFIYTCIFLFFDIFKY